MNNVLNDVTRSNMELETQKLDFLLHKFEVYNAITDRGNLNFEALKNEIFGEEDAKKFFQNK